MGIKLWENRRDNYQIKERGLFFDVVKTASSGRNYQNVSTPHHQWTAFIIDGESCNPNIQDTDTMLLRWQQGRKLTDRERTLSHSIQGILANSGVKRCGDK